MTKTARELAFLRDLTINEIWTSKFAELIDQHADLKDIENLLYINAGTGDHCIQLRERLDDDVAIFATCENEDLLSIARDKAAAVSADVDLSMIEFEEDAFDAVIADGSFTPPAELDELINEAVRVAKSGGRVAVAFPTAGSFGEIFSLLWEVFFSEGLGEHGSAAETLIADLPTLSRAKEMAESAGLIKVKTDSANEIFEFDDGEKFISAPLIADFLMPTWLETLDDEEKLIVAEKLPQMIDAEDNGLSFKFTVKATVLTARKA